MQISPTDVKEVRRLICSDEFKQIVDACEQSTTMLGILQDAFHENVLSRILRFLCDSSESHGLKDKFVRRWLRAIPSRPFSLGKGSHQIKAHFNWPVKTQSNTNRYIDLVLVISRQDTANPIAVVGVETKIDAPESDKQIQDYQEALCQRFRHGHRMLLFLTPDGRANQTGKIESVCKCHDISYDSVVSACELPSSGASKHTRMLLDNLSQFLSRDVMRDRRRSQIDQLVKELESDPASARALEILRGLTHRPTVRSFVYERLLPEIRKECGNVEVAWHNPRNTTRPNEFNFAHDEIRAALPSNSGFEIYYMLHSKEKEPSSGNYVSILLMAWLEKGRFHSNLKKRLELFRDTLPGSRTGHRWADWVCLWASDEYRLNGLDSHDAEKLAELYKRTVDVTKKPLLKFLKQL
jgi:hypothetical protein